MVLDNAQKKVHARRYLDRAWISVARTRGRPFVRVYVRTRVAILGLLISATLWSPEPSAWELYQLGREAEKAGHVAEAYLLLLRGGHAGTEQQDLPAAQAGCKRGPRSKPK